jgi:zinc transport system ATP-binding protein
MNDASTRPIIELDDISFDYGREPVLEDITLTVNHGDYSGIIGPNGGGKTTLLQIIFGLLKPSSGTVKLFGQHIHDFKDWPRLGYLPQRMTQADIRFPITVEEAVSQGRVAKAGLFKRLGAADRSAIERALKTSDVYDLRHRLISDLSGGERQRVFIARALASEPEILILDEPTAGIDVASQSRFYQFLKKLNTEFGLTILFVSHDVGVMVHESSTLICLNRRLVCEGTPSHVFKQDKDLLEKLYGEGAKYMFHV